MYDIPSYAVEVTFDTAHNPDANAQNCMEYLVQKHHSVIVGRISHHKLMFDVRTLVGEDDLSKIVEGMNSFTASLS